LVFVAERFGVCFEEEEIDSDGMRNAALEFFLDMTATFGKWHNKSWLWK